MALDLDRAAASASVSAAGAIVVAVMARRVLAGALPLSGVLFAGFGALIGAALIVGGYLIYRAGFTPRQTVRIAVWNALGIVVIGAAMGLFYAYQAAVGTPVTGPVFAGAVVVSVSAVAHVLIGYNDVRRIRARELARERQKLTVLNRLVRHNLRQTAQLLYGYADRIDTTPPEELDHAAMADRVERAGEDLAAVHEHIELIEEVIEETSRPAEPIDLSAVVDRVAAEKRSAHPEATITTSGPAGITAMAGEKLEAAIGEAVENAIVHADDHPPEVTVTVDPVDDEWIEVHVEDDGPGIPETERAIVRGDQPITQLEHASGLGLWLIRWVLEAYDGALEFGSPDDPGGHVIMRVRSA